MIPPGKKTNRMLGLEPLGVNKGKVEVPPGLKPVTTQPQQNHWKTISMTVDSGAVDTVFPVGTVTREASRQGIATRAGFKYYGADGREIPQLGVVKFQGKRKGKGF